MSANAVLKLQKAGFTTEQVEALADFMDTQAASKADLEKTEHRLDTRIAEMKTELKADIAAARIDALKIIIGTTIAAVILNFGAILGGMFGLAKLLGH